MTDWPLLTAEDIAEIVAILDGTMFERIEVTTKRVSVRVARSGDGWTQDWRHAPGEAEPDTVSDLVSVKSGDVADVPGLLSVRPPLPGAFYRAPQPGAPDFVAVGDGIKPDTIIGIIETMKVMNSVPAGVTGEIVEFLAENGQMVDKGSVLLRVRADE